MDSKRIQEITTEGIAYIDDDGSMKFIDFLDCSNTYVQWELSAPIITSRMAERARKSKRVGEINYLGDILEISTTGDTHSSQPYVEFYDNQLTRFEFADQNECAEFHQRVTKTGWTLFDLSD